ncbi:nucleolar protein 16 [Podospora conica]|nr:nucleolar protein 16 [Schizothecium conicum]
MGRELQKRKRRSSRPTVRTHNYRKKALNPQGSNIVAQEWDKKSTLSQNYQRFGLVSKLGASGLSSKSTTKSTKASSAPAPNPLAHNPSDRGLIRVQEVKVERDAQGRITRVIRDANPLRDPLNDVLDSDSDSDDGDDDEEWGGIDAPLVVRELEREAAQPTEKLVRHQSEREVEWLGDLVARHGDDVGAMARDAKLNPMQQTAADIRKRLKKAGLLG